MEIYQNRIRRQYLKDRSASEMVVGTVVFIVLLAVVGISCSFGNDLSVEDLEDMVTAEAAATSISAEDVAMMELYGWEKRQPVVMVGHVLPQPPIEVIVYVDGEPELVSVVK